MERIIPWIALLTAVAALVLGLAPAPTAAPSATPQAVHDDPRVAALEREVAALRADLARRPSASDLETMERRLASDVPTPTIGENSASVDEARVRVLIEEAIAKERERFAMRPGAPGTVPGQGPALPEPADPAILSAKIQEQFQIEAEPAAKLAAAMAEMQTSMRTAFANPNAGNREQAFAAMREAREKFQAVVEETLPEDKRENLRGFLAENLGMRGRPGGDGRPGGGRPNREPAPAAPAPGDVKEF